MCLQAPHPISRAPPIPYPQEEPFTEAALDNWSHATRAMSLMRDRADALLARAGFKWFLVK
jgi:hypothetical protein